MSSPRLCEANNNNNNAEDSTAEGCSSMALVAGDPELEHTPASPLSLSPQFVFVRHNPYVPVLVTAPDSASSRNDQSMVPTDTTQSRDSQRPPVDKEVEPRQSQTDIAVLLIGAESITTGEASQLSVVSTNNFAPSPVQVVTPPLLQASTFQEWLQQQGATVHSRNRTATEGIASTLSGPQGSPPPDPNGSLSASLPQSNASRPPAMKVMCCYHKKNGNCSKGKKCWYSHEGDLNTPCHYGAKCVAGHASLTLLAQRAIAKSFDASVQEMCRTEMCLPTVRVGGAPPPSATPAVQPDEVSARGLVDNNNGR